MKPRRVPANPSAQHIWKRLALMPSKSSEGPGRQAEENLTPESLGLGLPNLSGRPWAWPTAPLPQRPPGGARGAGGQHQ